MKSLNEIYQNYQSPEGHGDKGTAHTYINEYEKLLGPYRENSVVLEIGICQGESLKMWNEYFINSTVYGIDITDQYIKDLINENKYNIIIGDATSEEILTELSDLKFDVIIDDGSHRIGDQINSFNILKDKMKSNGIYIIEDVNNIDSSIDKLTELHNNIEIIDNRHIKNRVDDVLAVYKF
jgi:hypothetical protein